MPCGILPVGSSEVGSSRGNGYTIRGFSLAGAGGRLACSTSAEQVAIACGEETGVGALGSPASDVRL
jgi:hypothetical protein